MRQRELFDCLTCSNVNKASGIYLKICAYKQPIYKDYSLGRVILQISEWSPTTIVNRSFRVGTAGQL